MQAPKPARQAKEDDSEDASGSESDSDAQSEDEPAAAVRPNAAKQKVETLPRPAPAAAKVSPKGVRARLQQAAAGAATRQEAADTAARQEAAQDAQPAAAIPTAALSSPAAKAVTPEILPSYWEPDSNLNLSASPTLPYDSPDMQTDSSPAPFATQVSYTNADSAALAALNAQTLDFSDAAPATTGEDESAAQPDFLAAPAISNAEEPAAAAVGGAVKSTRGASNCQTNATGNLKASCWATSNASLQAEHLKGNKPQCSMPPFVLCFVFCCLGVCRVCRIGTVLAALFDKESLTQQGPPLQSLFCFA